ncbi:MAG: protein-L-isoaspartate O-methyltransferase [Alphaproteobacteria bacterium]|nr:protein-L-isoaspartate O-methyltransferase [Alphaproteobacteria bacterium]
MAVSTNRDDDIYETARFNMVECQQRPGGVRDARLVARLKQIPREAFVAVEHSEIAYADCVLSCGVGSATREMLSPLAFALLVEMAAISPDDVVLDIAGGTGYGAAIMAGLAGAVIALEEHEPLSKIADAIWADLGIDNAVSVSAPLAQGVAKQAPFNVIFINGCVEEVPAALLAQMEEGGRLVCVQMIMGCPKAVVYNRAGMATLKADVPAPNLPQFSTPATFQF